jgi:two-component system sensor histidine kinase KdpD
MAPRGDQTTRSMARGTLRIYLGAAPGVGKTYAMLNEGWRRAQRGTDVVVALAEFHGRPHTAEQLRDLEVVPRLSVSHRGRTYEEMDLDAVLARRPEVALVDELAHTNIPGLRPTKRWQDIEELLDAGITVISTVNVQHLESLNDVVTAITGITQHETVPDAVVRAADQLELVDMSPESLRRRMAHGNIYPPERVDVALSNYFREGNLAALRELALLWVADQVEEGLQDYRERHGILQPWETKERVVVALTGSPSAERVIRRGARMAARTHAELVGIHVNTTDGLARPRASALAAHQQLLSELGGRYAEVTGGDAATALVDFAMAENASQLLLGSTHRSRWQELTRGSVVNQVIRRAGDIDVHVISARPRLGEPDADGGLHLPRPPARRRLVALSRRRVLTGWILAVVGMPGLVLALTPARHGLGPTGALPELLLGVVIVAAVGGVAPGLAGAAIGFGFADWFLIPPVHTLTIGRAGDLVALLSFLVTAAVVSALIDTLARRGLTAARARSEAEALARLAGRTVLSGQETLPRLVEELRSSFDLDAVAVLGPRADGGWETEVASGAPVPASPDEAVFAAELTAGSVLVLTGEQVKAEDRPLLSAFVNQLRFAQDSERLADTVAEATSLAEANELRTALLTAVSHDLRTPLASIKASVTSLLSAEVSWSADHIRSFLEAIDQETDRLTDLVANLLDMSRLQTGVLHPDLQPVGAEEVVFSALTSLSGDTSRIQPDVPETLPPVLADPPLLERALANLMSNALAWTPHGGKVRIDAGHGPTTAHRDGTTCPLMALRIVDRGPGIPPDRRDTVFQPFQRFGDSSDASPDGVGLGMAVARGFVEAMGGEIILDDTPGGGLTVIVLLPEVLP